MRCLISPALIGGMCLFASALLAPETAWAQPCELAFNHNSLPLGSLEVGPGPDLSPTFIDQGIELVFDFYGPPDNLQYGYAGAEPNSNGFGFTQVLFLDDISAVYKLTEDALAGTTVGQISILFDDQSGAPEELSINNSPVLAWNLPDFENYTGPTPWSDDIDVTVEMEPGSATSGQLIVTGPATKIQIGSDRLYLDDFCVNPDDLPTDGGGGNGNLNYFVEVEVVNDNLGMVGAEDLTGYGCYRLYVHLTSPEEQLLAVYGDLNRPLDITTTTQFFHDGNGGPVASGVNPTFFPFFPSLEYDSWVTIGIAQTPNAALGEAAVTPLEDSEAPWIAAFDPGGAEPGSSIVINSAAGGAWFAPADATNGIAGDDLRVLVGQFTTDGDLSGQLYASVLPPGQTEPIDIFLPFGEAGPTGGGCTYEVAINFDPEATVDDGTCIFVTCPDACDADLDEDGVCDDVDPCVGTVDAIGICGGSCTADLDGDGECDDEDCCVGSYDECGICNGPGAIYDCGCDVIPPGACDCSGSVLDALGDCGGDCPADADGDGICDTVDECVGTMDACGICNGPGAVYACGCFPLPAGDCDCEGNQIDALGICGGDCETDTDGDGVCDTSEVPGCTDPTACNFNPEATDESGDCTYAEPGFTCAGDCIIDTDGDGICDDLEIGGCTDPEACNFNDDATDDSGCFYPAPGFNCAGECLEDADDDGVCDSLEILGCTEDEACNFNPDATEESGICLFPQPGFDCAGNCLEDADGDGICDGLELLGCLEDEACNFNPEAQQSDSSCIYPPFGYDCFGQCLNDSDGDGICDVFEVAGCMDVTACNFNPQATQPNDLCDYPPAGYTCDGDCLDFDGDGVCDVDEVLGCTYSNASNYDALATEENGTCEFPTGGGGGSGCPDLDGDGVVAINDLLNMLGAFGTSPDC